MPVRKAEARWDGDIQKGKGTVALGSGAFKGSYSFDSRFGDGKGTNPEELIGAAHAGCFSMALSLFLGTAGFQVDSIETEARVHIDKVGEGFSITKIELLTEGKVKGISEADFRKHAENAKKNCPVSRALAGTEITLQAKLVS